MYPFKRKLTLDQEASYTIKVLGCLDKSWSDYTDHMSITADEGGGVASITTISVSMDQAALQGLLRRLYALGLPLVSVECLDIEYRNTKHGG